MHNNGYIVPDSILYDNNLSNSELRLYIILINNIGKNDFINFTNVELSSLTNISSSTISKKLSSLRKKGYISILLKDNNKRIITIDLDRFGIKTSTLLFNNKIG